jgi:hypothetical protein
MEAGYTVRGEEFLADRSRLWAKKESLGEFDLAPDGERFAVVQAETHPTQVTILLNFFDALQRAPAGGK